ncbi:MAG: filamentous hemagglutinin [Hyphomicrobiales bacterium]|jgi:hypothetical protein|nr:filamentous hemagglutinin [Hyphomicrobiales bacterium]
MAWIDSRYLDQQRKLEREVLQLRRQWDELKFEITARRTAARREVKAARIAFEKLWHDLQLSAEQKAGFNPDQPRDDQGKWTDSGRSGDAGKDGNDRARSTDISAQRRLGPRPAGTPAQHARLDLASGRAREAIARVQQLDPNWRPASMMSRDNPRDMEAMIHAKEAETREAEARYVVLANAGHDDSFPRRDAQTTTDVLRAEAARSPTPGSDKDTRTVSSARFEELRLELMGGARRMGPDPGYDGVIYRRQDGSEIGLRISHDYGLTLDVLRNNDRLIPSGFKVHQR